MPKTSDELIAIDVRNQIMLERLKEGELRKFAPYLKRIEREVRARIGDEGDIISTKKRLNVLLSDVQKIQQDIYEEYIAQLNGDLSDIAVSQSEFEAKSYEKIVVDYESKLPTPAQVITAYSVSPLQVQNYAGDPLLEPFIKDWSKKETARVKSVIQQGYAQGQTNSDMVREIRGTRANNYRDGILATTNRNARSVVRTSVQHVATQARQATMKANSDLIKQYEWVSTLDSSTSDLCKGLDGRRFDIGKGLLPPAHPNCRSVVTSVLNEGFDFLDDGATRASRGAEGGQQVDAKETYYSWLKKQPASFQDVAIGKSRGKLLRNGGLTSEQFSRLSLDRNFNPLTLEEMRRLEPAAFERAGI